MKYQSRLTALLLALMMVITTVVSAEETTTVGFSLDDLTSAQVETFETEAEALAADKCTTCVNEFLQRDATIVFPDGYDCIYTYFATVTPIEAYDHLMDLWALYESEAIDPTYTVYLNCHNTHVYNAVNTEEEANYPSVVCNEDYCTASQWPVESPLHADHSETCPWYVNSTALTEAEKLACTFKYHTAEADKPAFVAPIEEELFYAMLDVLGWVENTTLTSGDVSVVGAVPAGTELAANVLGTEDKLTSDVRDFILEQSGIDLDAFFSDCRNTVDLGGYDISLSFYGREIEPKAQLTVTIANVHDNSQGAENVDAYIIHVLETADSIAKETAAGNTVYYTTESALVDAYTNYEAGKVAYTLVSDTNSSDNVTISDNGSMTFTVDSLSDVIYDIGTADGADISYYTDTRVGYFYWRFDEEQTSHTYGDGTDTDAETDDTDCFDDVVASVTYVSDSTDQSGTVPHYTYAGHTTTNTGVDLGNLIPFSDPNSGCTINITTQPGYIVTSFVIACENWRAGSANGKHPGEGCTTVSANNLTVSITDEGYYTNLNIILESAKPFAHGANKNASGSEPMNYVLLIEVQEVNASIAVEKTANPTIVTENDDIQFQITATNNSTTEYEGGRTYTSAKLQDGYFGEAKSITSVQLLKKDSDGNTTATYNVSYSASSDGTYALTFPSGATWAPGDQLVITYKYTATDADATAGSLTNVALVTGILVDGTTVSDTGVASVKVIVNQDTKGNLRVVKTFKGLTLSEVQALTTQSDTNTTPFTLTAVSTNKNYSSLTDGEVSVTTSGDDVVLYWDIIGAIESSNASYTEDFTVTESNYEVADYTWSPTDTVKTATVKISETAVVTFTNSYSNQPQTGSLAITKTVENDTVYTDLDDEFTFTVALTDAAGAALTGDVTYTIGDDSTTVTLVEGKFNLTLKDDQTATIADLPAGTEYTVTETDIPAGYTVDAASKDGTITAGTESAVTFTNTYSVGTLKITKTVTGEGAPTNDTFTIEVALTAPTSPAGRTLASQYAYTITGTQNVSGNATVTEGKITIPGIKNGDTITINDLMIGTGYQVEEINPPSYYDVTYSGDQGTISTTLSEATVTNAYQTGSLKITKVVDVETSDDTVPTDASFKIQVTFTPPEDYTMPATLAYSKNGTDAATPLTVTDNTVVLEDVKDDDTFIIEGIVVGTTYTVLELETEQKPYAVGYTGQTGTISTTLSEAMVTNAYQTGSLKITKTVEGNMAPTTDTFTFVVTLPAGTYKYTQNEEKKEIQSGGTVTLSAGESVIIESIPAKSVVTVVETENNAYIPNPEDRTQTATIVAGDTVEVEFTNTYNLGALSITKTVVNNTIYASEMANDDFTFTVALTKDNAPLAGTYNYTVVDADGNSVADRSGTITNGTGTIILKHGQTATIAALPVGTVYTITEAEKAGYTTTQSGDTKAIAANETCAVVFTNTYVVGELTITKKVTGATAADADDTFIFTVTGEDVNLTVMLKPGADGTDSVKISNLKVGTYTVTEDTTWSWRYSCDDASKDATLSTSDLTGELVFTNSKTNDSWIDGSTSADNVFKTVSTSTETN